MKNRIIKYMPVLFGLALCCSCSDFLERTNPESETEAFFSKGETEAVKIVNAAYSVMQKNSMYMRGIEIINAVRSDEGTITPNTSKMEENVVSLATYQNNASEKMTEMLWRELYDGVHKSNVVIERVPGMNISDEIKNRILGEGYFLRGFYNFHLVMYFGERIPIRDKTASSQTDLEKGPAENGQIWNLIMNDFAAAQSYLEKANYVNTSSTYEKGRATLGAATAYLGKAYLYYAQMVLKNQGDAQNYYNKAAAEFAKVISQEVGTYALQTSYRDNFTNANEYNAESLFEVGFTFSGTKVWEVDQDNADCVEMNWVAMIGGMTSDCGVESPRYWNYAATRRLLRQYETNDYRRIYTLWAENGAWYKEKEVIYAYNTDAESTGKESMNFPMNPFVKGEENLYIGFRKYDYDFNQQTNEYVGKAINGLSDINIRTMRYADVLLMYAETLALGATDVAGKTINACLSEIRQRANNMITATADPYQAEYGNPLPYFTQQGQLPDAYPFGDNLTKIQHERMVELAGESHRYFDIIRWFNAGILKDIDPSSPTRGATINNVDELREKVIKEPAFKGVFVLPIPQYELNTNRNMIPNEAN